MILPILMALAFGADSAPSDTLTPEAIVEQIESRFETFEKIPNLYIAMECPTGYGAERLAYARRDDGVYLDAVYQDWQKGRAPNQLGEDSTIRLHDNGWVTEIHRDFSGERAFLRHGVTPPEPRYELRMMLGFCCWSSPKDARCSILEATGASVRVLPAEYVDQVRYVGIERTYPTRWGDEQAERCDRYWFVPEKAMALKRYKTIVTSATRSEERTWTMSDFVELGNGFWIATHAHVEEPDKEYDVQLTEWSLEPIDLGDARYGLGLRDGTQCRDDVFNQDMSWKEGWSVPEMIMGKKGCGRGLRPQEFRLSSDNSHALARALAQAVPATFKGRCDVLFTTDLPELSQSLRELISSREEALSANDNTRAPSIRIDIAPLDRRRAVAFFAKSEGNDFSEWAVLYKRSWLGGDWRVVRQGQTATITSDPPLR